MWLLLGGLAVKIAYALGLSIVGFGCGTASDDFFQPRIGY
jgi:hypothetical protein